MTCMTTNHENKACTVWVSRMMTNGDLLECHITYLNREQVWPIRNIALEFANDHVECADEGWR